MGAVPVPHAAPVEPDVEGSQVMSMSEPTEVPPLDVSATLVSGELVAYRAWDLTWSIIVPVARAAAEGVHLLQSISGRATLRPFQQSYRAVCERLIGRPQHDAPSSSCTCGFYGVYVGGFMQLLDVMNIGPTYMWHPRTVFGAVALSGRVIVEETGVARGANMRLLGLCIPRNQLDHGREVKALSDLEHYYQVPGFVDFDAFHQAFPLSGVSNLVQPRVRWSNEASVRACVRMQDKIRDKVRWHLRQIRNNDYGPL